MFPCIPSKVSLEYSLWIPLARSVVLHTFRVFYLSYICFGFPLLDLSDWLRHHKVALMVEYSPSLRTGSCVHLASLLDMRLARVTQSAHLLFYKLRDPWHCHSEVFNVIMRDWIQRWCYES